jgi:hypothetical protein
MVCQRALAARYGKWSKACGNIQDPDNDLLNPTLALACHIAAQISDVDLANVIADLASEFLLREQEPGLLRQMFYRIVEAAAANDDSTAARTALAKRLEMLAFQLPISEAIVELVYLLKALRSVVPELAPLLARAIAAADLAAAR